MPPGADNTVSITVQVVDANSQAVLTGVQQKLQGVGAAGAVAGTQLGGAAAATARYSSALEQLGKSASLGNAQALGIIAQYKSEMEQATAATTSFGSAIVGAGRTGGAAGDQIAKGMGGAYGQMRLVSGLGRELGLNIDYGLRRVLATMPGVTSALSALLPLFGAIGVVALLLPAVEGAVHLAEKYADLDEAVDKYIEKAREAASEQLVGGDSIETTTTALVSIGNELDELDKKRAHFFEQWRIDGTNIQLPGAGMFQYLIPTSDIWTKDMDARAAYLAELQAKGNKAVLEQTGKLDETRLHGQQQYDDAVDKGYAKIAAHERDEIALIHSRYATKRALILQDAKTAGVRPDYASVTAQESAEVDAAHKGAKGQGIALAQTTTDELIKLDAQARDAKLAGISLLRAQESDAIAEVTRKYREAGQSRQAIDRAVADTRAKYDGDIQKALDAQQNKIEQIRHEAESAGLTGIAKIQSDSAFQIAEINSPAAKRDTSDAAVSARDQETSYAKEKADGDILAEQRRFGDEMDKIVEHNADQVLTGYAKIDAETRRSLDAIHDNYKKTYGQLDFFNLKPEEQVAVLQGAQKEGAANASVEDASQREKLKYTQEIDRQVAQTEAEAARATLPPWQAAQQKIADDYALRVQKIQEDLDEQVAAEKGHTDAIALLNQQASRQVSAAWQLASAEMIHQTEQARDQLAGKLQSFFDNPAKFMQERAKQIGFDLMANLLQGAEENDKSGKLQGLVGGLFGLNKVGTGSPKNALGTLFGAHTSEQSAGGGQLIAAGSTLQTAGHALIAAAQAFYKISGTAGASRVGAGGIGTGGGFNAELGGPATPAGLYSGESLGIPTSGATGGIGEAANAALGIAGAAGHGGGSTSSIGSVAEQGLQLSGLLRTAATSNAPLLNPNATGGPFPGAQPTDINTPPVIDANGNVVPQGGVAGGGGIGVVGGGLAAISGGLAAFGDAESAFNAPTFASGLVGAAELGLTGAELGFTFGGPVGAAIGAAAGFAAGLVTDLFGDRGASKMRHYNVVTVIPGLQQAMEGFSFGGSTYDSATQAINNIELQAQKEAQSWGTGAMGVYKSTIVPEVTNAEAQVVREGGAGRSAVTFGVAQFHGGGVITGFGDLATSEGTGFIHARLGEHITDDMTTARALSRSTVDVGSLMRGPALGLGSGSGDGGSPVQIHIHAIDAESFERSLRGGLGDRIANHLNQRASRYAGKAQNSY